MESVVALLSQELSGRIISVKLWKTGGLIAFATGGDLIGDLPR